MERDHAQLKSLELFGSIKESFKIVFSWKRIFTLITLTLILPLSFIYLAHVRLSNLLSSKINADNQTDQPGSSSNYFSKKSYLLRLLDLAYTYLFLTISLLSTGAVVYTVACIFTAKQTTFKEVISVVPRLYKRLFATHCWTSAVILVYSIVGVGVLALLTVLLADTVVLAIVVIAFVAYVVGLAYICTLWQLANIISVLEEMHGLKAMIKSRNLIKGEMARLAVGTFILFGILLGGVFLLFDKLVVSKWSENLAIAIPVAILCLVLLSVVFLFLLVVQTIVYFVCKSYHNEIIHKSSLSVHLEEYLGDSARLNRSNDVQLEQMQSRV